MLQESSSRAGVRAALLEPSPPKLRRRPAWRGIAQTYDGRIVERGEIPTREHNWHDLMNALAWICFPRSKWSLHRAQYDALCIEVAACGGQRPHTRGRTRDYLTLLDEAGSLELSLDRVEGCAETTLTGEPLSRTQTSPDWRLSIPFGHALYENAALGRPEVTPWPLPLSALRWPCDPRSLRQVASMEAGERREARDWIDEQLAAQLAVRFASSRQSSATP